jgi:N-6 DNA Methylase
VTLPCTLWFFDKAKSKGRRKDEVLFIDARHIYRQVTRAIRDFRPEQIEFLSNIVRLHRGEKVETGSGSKKLLAEHFPKSQYRDVAGLCRVATRAEIASQSWSLSPSRYVGIAEGERITDEDFRDVERGTGNTQRPSAGIGTDYRRERGRDFDDMITPKWQAKRMDELCDVTSSKRIYARELCSSGVPFLRCKEIIEKVNGYESLSMPLFISEERFREILSSSAPGDRQEVGGESPPR